jgi:hypothetical protein
MDGDGTKICPRKKRFGHCPMMNRCAHVVVFHWNLRAGQRTRRLLKLRCGLTVASSAVGATGVPVTVQEYHK